MGLDMYLNKKTYVKQWDHQSPEEKYEVVVTKGGKPVDGIKASRVKYIEEEVGYWRKANQIHRWFVENVQNGVDNCGDYYVSQDKLTELKDICEHALETKDPSILPPQAGFFFGGTDIDEWYFHGLDDTVKGLNQCLDMDDSWSFYYCSSW